MSAPPLAFESVGVDYVTSAGALRAVENVSLTLQAGEFLSLLGPSGCDKTSLLKLATGLAKLSSGRVLAAITNGRNAAP